MRTARLLPAAVAASAMVVCPDIAAAQMYETVGTRAQGMGGAFVAVSDDATATWWNPAGLVAGPLMSLALERSQLTQPADRTPETPAWRSGTVGLSVMFPTLGLSYYRLRVSEIGPPSATADGVPDRQDQEGGAVGVRSLAVSQYGATVGQSLGRHLVIASTLKLVRGGVTTSDVVSRDPLQRAEDLDVRLHTRSDLDLGAMAALGSIRLGISLKNLREPTFGGGVDRLALRRQARAGAALMTEGRGQVITAAFDVDLTRTRSAVGDVRHVAAGLESWLLQRRVGLRGGVSIDTVGPRVYSTSAGASLSLKSGLYLNGAVAVGSDRSREGWAASLGMMF
jgi:hypothetical protein